MFWYWANPEKMKSMSREQIEDLLDQGRERVDSGDYNAAEWLEQELEEAGFNEDADRIFYYRTSHMEKHG